jgi:hypothetical protein
MYSRDHNPPHFHAIEGDDEALFRISDLQIHKGSLSPPSVQAVRTWASTGNRQASLALNWIFGMASMQMRNIP